MSTNKRESLRLGPSQGDPLKVIFKQDKLQKLSSQIKVLDISLGGIGLQIPDAKSKIRIGMYIEMEVPIPEEEVCVLSGRVTFVKGDKCGINFVQSRDREIDKIARYLFNREREIQQLKKEEHTK